jgi:hypothetical protein
LNAESSIQHFFMFILDSLLIGGLRFVLDKLAMAVDTELNDDTALKEQLLAAQMRLELGELTQEEFDRLEADILVRLRELRERREGGAGAPMSSDTTYAVTGIDASFEGDEHALPTRRR